MSVITIFHTLINILVSLQKNELIVLVSSKPFNKFMPY